jgi:putative membrane protein
MTDSKTSTLVWLVVGLVLAVALIGVAAAVSSSGTDGDYGMMHGGSWGFGMAFMAVPVIVLILVLVVVIAGIGDRPAQSTYPVYVPAQPGAVDILDHRYARGELSTDEYHRMRAELGRR